MNELLNCNLFCSVNGTSFDIENIDIVVRKGSCIRPLLFLLDIIDLPYALNKAKKTVHADDALILFSCDNIDKCNAVLNAELQFLVK